MTFLVDAQLPPSLASALRDAGFSAVAVREVGLREAKDAEIWQYAIAHQMAIITKDEDFAQRCAISDLAPTIIWLRVGNVTNPDLINWLMPQWELVVACMEAGDILIELR